MSSKQKNKRRVELINELTCKFEVYFDGQCPLCKREIEMILENYDNRRLSMAQRMMDKVQRIYDEGTNG